LGRTDPGSGRACKGSQYWIQTLVRDARMRQELNGILRDTLEWLSPLEKERYAEYELRDPVLLGKLGLDGAEGLFGFWPEKQPVWDGIAVGNDGGNGGRTLYLIEAKAHPGEMESRMRAKNPESVRKILQAMRHIHDTCFPAGEFPLWTDRYYQLANRLTFLQYLRNAAAAGTMGDITEVRLVLLYFAEDYTYRKTGAAVWREHLDTVYSRMLGVPVLPREITSVLYSVPPADMLS